MDDTEKGELGVTVSEVGQTQGNEGKSMNPCRQILKIWKTLVVLLTPIVLLPIPLVWPDKVSEFFSSMG